MKIKQDPITGLWCREDGAVLMPPFPNIQRFTHTWTFGSRQPNGYRAVQRNGKRHQVHRMICRAFNGLPPADKPFVDHINRIRDDNRPSNLHWVCAKENSDNAGSVDKSVEAYGARACEDRKAYMKAYSAALRAEKKAQGLAKRKGPDGKFGWYPRIRTKPAI